MKKILAIIIIFITSSGFFVILHKNISSNFLDIKGNVIDLKNFSPKKQLTIEIIHSDGRSDIIKANHTYNGQQIEWYKEGSALNLIKKQNANNN